MTAREKCIAAIVELELEMFLTVPSDGIYSCQQDAHGFRMHRRAQFSIWSGDTLQSYLGDLTRAKTDGINLMTVKYARMEGRIPSANPTPLIEDIVTIQMRWQAEMIRKYPGIMAGGRPLSEAADDERLTSFETYLRGELETYSDTTLKSLLDDMHQIEQQGENGSALIYTSLVRKMGFADLDAAEKQQG